MKLNHNLHYIICLLFFASCAKQTTPTGGPKDTIPPTLVKSFPANESIHFKGKSIALLFDEMVIANNPKEQLIITPSIGKDFEVKAKKNSIVIDLEKSLQDSTTYTFNFRESVQDITEKNPVENLQLAISTGSYVDSLSIEGSVFDILKGQEIKDATVAINPQNDTFSILKHPATYFTKTNEKGYFKIDHLRPGLYHIYAMQDNNRNLVADSRTEAYGFLADPINLTEDTAGISIGLVRLDARALKLTSARPYNNYFNLRTNKNLVTFSINAPDSAELAYAFGEDQSNIRLYNTFGKIDSLSIRFMAEDSIGNKLDTILFAKYSDREVTPEKFEMKVTETSLLADKGKLRAILSFTKPLKELNLDSIFFQVDSLNKITFKPADLNWEQLHNTLTITKAIDKKLYALEPEADPTDQPTRTRPADKKKKTKEVANELHLGKGAFMSVDADSSKKSVQNITPLRTDDLSMILYNIKTIQKVFIVQLLNKNYNVIQEQYNTAKGQFEDLNPGEYQLRVVIDKNNNRKWDAGNYALKEQPEPAFYYKDDKGNASINLKTNWEYELSPMLIKY